MEKEKEIRAPFTPEQVKYLTAYQNLGLGHPFTCMGHDGCNRSLNKGKLVATRFGWTCPCGAYKQEWAYSFMLE